MKGHAMRNGDKPETQAHFVQDTEQSQTKKEITKLKKQKQKKVKNKSETSNKKTPKKNKLILVSI